MTTPKPTLDGLRAALDRAVKTLADPSSRPSLERPKQAEHGDFSTNAAMLLAKPLGRPPREIAADLEQAIAKEFGTALDLRSEEHTSELQSLLRHSYAVFCW